MAKNVKIAPISNFYGVVGAVAPIFKGMHNLIDKLGTAKLEVFQSFEVPFAVAILKNTFFSFWIFPG